MLRAQSEGCQRTASYDPVAFKRYSSITAKHDMRRWLLTMERTQPAAAGRTRHGEQWRTD